MSRRDDLIAVQAADYWFNPPDVSKVEILDWNGSGLRRIPKDLKEYLSCKALQARENNFLYVHIRLKQLANLVSLDMSHNTFSVVPVAIFGLPLLQHLDLSHNELENADCNFPAWLYSIQTVLLDHNRLLDLPIWWMQAPKLENFSISFNKLQPQEKFNIEKFKVLSGIETDFPSTAQIKVLRMAGCDLNELPIWLRVLHKLRELHLNHPKQSPREDKKFCLPPNHNFVLRNLKLHLSSTLEVLNLENVGLANVPDELHHLDKLQVLILRRNKISYLPDSFTKLISLEICDLSECCLMDLPLGIAELLNLKSLWLHGNKIAYLPKCMKKMTSLECVDLYCNSLDSFPNELLVLKSLKNFDVELNLFESSKVLSEELVVLYASKRNALRCNILGTRIMGPSYLNPNFKLSQCEEILKSVAPVESDLQSGSMLQPLKKFGSVDHDSETESDKSSVKSSRSLQILPGDEDWSTASDFGSEDFDVQLHAKTVKPVEYEWMISEKRLGRKISLPRCEFLTLEPGRFDDLESSSDDES